MNVQVQVPSALHTELVAVSVTYPGVVESAPKLVIFKPDVGPAMVSDRVPELVVKVLMGMPLPLLSRTVKVTVGALPAAPLVTFWRTILMPGI